MRAPCSGIESLLSRTCPAQAKRAAEATLVFLISLKRCLRRLPLAARYDAEAEEARDEKQDRGRHRDGADIRHRQTGEGIVIGAVIPKQRIGDSGEDEGVAAMAHVVVDVRVPRVWVSTCLGLHVLLELTMHRI